MQNEQVPLVMIVDDNRHNLSVLFKCLSGVGYKVSAAINGDDALKKLTRITPDLILLDVMMPIIDGFEVCRRVKAGPAGEEIPIIFMTALYETPNKILGLGLGAVDYITKPFQHEEVLARVRLHLNLRLLTKKLQEKNLLLTQEIAAHNLAQTALSQLNHELERRVVERTQALSTTLQELYLQEEKLRYEAFHDSLTGLYNRAWLMQYLSQILSSSTEDCAILFLDLDRFKSVNDRLGHFVGDQLLKAVAHRLSLYLNKYGYMVRLGGDEFLILLTTPQGIAQTTIIAESILDQLSSPFLCDNYSITTSASIGIIGSLLGYENAVNILRDADIAMYRAKSIGAGQYAILTEQMRSQALERLQIETDIRLGIERGEFYLYYQPIIALDSLSVVGFEGLLRWRHPALGLLTPDKFIYIAEEIGLIERINFLSFKTACQQLHEWLKVYNLEPGIFMSVNLSPIQLQYEKYITYANSILKQYKLPTSMIKLEITESGFSEQIPTIDRILQEIDMLGIKLCIDDFGTGYSSLSRLHNLPISTIKIDRSFVSRLDCVDGFEIVQTIITFAHNLGMDIVAEGIETHSQLDILQKMGCELGQGYLFSPPVSSEHIAQFIISPTLAFNHK